MKYKQKRIKLVNFLGVVGILSLPSLVFAANDLKGAISVVTDLITTAVIPLIFALALAFFVWGVVQYVINSGEETKKEKAKQYMLWGIIGLTVMVSVWGLVNILGDTFDIVDATPPSIPQLPQ